jgi:hypothetical protein
MEVSYRSTSVASGGRGPTSDMEPPSTLNSCGSSSRENRRSQRPIGVTRGSWRILNSTPSCSLSAITSDSRVSAPSTMLRNLRIV